MTPKEYREMLEAVQWGKDHGLLSLAKPQAKPRCRRIKSNLLSWQSIGTELGYSASYCRFVWIGKRQNPVLKTALDQMAATRPMPPTYRKHQ